VSSDVTFHSPSTTRAEISANKGEDLWKEAMTDIKDKKAIHF
jgi:hypothetical protein